MDGTAPPPKRARRSAPVVEHHRVSLDSSDSLADMRARSSTLRAGLPVHAHLQTIRDEVNWDEIESWEPEDDLNFALDADSHWFDEDMSASIHEVLDKADAAEDMQEVHGVDQKKARSQASVRFISSLRALILIPPAGATPGLLEDAPQRRLPRQASPCRWPWRIQGGWRVSRLQSSRLR